MNIYHELSLYVHGIPLTGLPRLESIARIEISSGVMRKFIDVARSVDEELNLLLLGVFHEFAYLLATGDYSTVMGGIDKSKLAKSGIYLPSI